MAIDLGSSGVRAAVAEASLASAPPLAVARVPLRSFRPPDGPELAREFDPADIRRQVRLAVRSAVREAARSAGVRASGVAAVAVTGQREAIALFDASGGTVYIGPNNDLRGAFEGAAIDDEHASLIWRATGHLPSFMLAWSKLAWFRQQAPETYERAAHVTTLGDWLVHELTGELRIERALGVEAGLVELESGEAATGLAARLGLADIAIPKPVNAGDVAGPVRRRASEEFGIPEGATVVCAGPDSQAALLGMGVADPGATGIVAGWSGVAQRVTGRPVLDPDRGLWSGRHVAPDRFVVEANTGVMGGAYEWLVRLTSGGSAGSREYAAADRAAGRKGRSDGSVSAHLGPAALNMSRAGLQAGGLIFPVPLALDPPDAGALCRAALENFAFAFRAGVEKLDALVPHRTPGPGRHMFAVPNERAVAPVHVGGGLTRNATFRRVLTDVLPCPVRFGSPDASLLGALTLGETAIEAVDFATALRGRATACRAVRPDPAAAEEYDGLYEQWRHRGDLLAQIGL
jgi:sugar (pentulose or hexulose) kinase